MEAGDRSPASVVYFVLQPQQWCSQQQSSHLRAKLILRPHPMANAGERVARRSAGFSEGAEHTC